MNKKKALIIYGSSRKKGLTTQMANICRNLLSSSNWDYDVVRAYEINQKPCIGCLECRKTGRCYIKDDVENVRKKLVECDLLVIAAPTYFANIPGPVKNLFDRLSGAVVDANTKPRLRKTQQYLLITACNAPVPFNKLAGQSSGSLRAMNEFCKIAGMSCKGKIALPGAQKYTTIPRKIEEKIGWYLLHT